jgi:hypothetical protein
LSFVISQVMTDERVGGGIREAIIWIGLASRGDLSGFWPDVVIAAASWYFGIWLLRWALRELASDEAFLRAAQSGKLFWCETDVSPRATFVSAPVSFCDTLAPLISCRMGSGRC